MLHTYVTTVPLALELDPASQVDMAAPADPANVHETVPVGATPPNPFTVAVNVMIEPCEPDPTPVRTTAGVTCAMMTIEEETAATEL